MLAQRSLQKGRQLLEAENSDRPRHRGQGT
jgi:hypothetical protein